MPSQKMDIIPPKIPGPTLSAPKPSTAKNAHVIEVRQTCEDVLDPFRVMAVSGHKRVWEFRDDTGCPARHGKAVRTRDKIRWLYTNPFWFVAFDKDYWCPASTKDWWGWSVPNQARAAALKSISLDPCTPDSVHYVELMVAKAGNPKYVILDRAEDQVGTKPGQRKRQSSSKHILYIPPSFLVEATLFITDPANAG